MGKKKQQITAQSLESTLLDEYRRWKQIFDEGCSDPFWEDGVNIQLTRNHILHTKGEIQRHLKDNFIAYPDSFFYPEPIQLPNYFMAVDRYMPLFRRTLTATKNLSYNEAIRFDWSEVLNE